MYPTPNSGKIGILRSTCMLPLKTGKAVYVVVVVVELIVVGRRLAMYIEHCGGSDRCAGGGGFDVFMYVYRWFRAVVRCYNVFCACCVEPHPSTLVHTWHNRMPKCRLPDHSRKSFDQHTILLLRPRTTQAMYIRPCVQRVWQLNRVEVDRMHIIMNVRKRHDCRYRVIMSSI